MNADKNDKDRITSDEFAVIDQLISNIRMMRSGFLSAELHQKLMRENDEIKKMMDEETYNKIVNDVIKLNAIMPAAEALQ